MNLSDIVSRGCDKVEMMGNTYESIVWKHITEEEYDNLSEDDKSSYTFNESSYEGSGPKYTLKQLLRSDGIITYHNLLSTAEYDQLDENLKLNYKLATKMYRHVPIPLENIKSAYSKYLNETKPLSEMRQKRDLLLGETDKYTIPDWPHATPEKKQEWLDYRQTLRDLPTATEDPTNPAWPSIPTA
tara:strand:+ start:484 stop:1041 length:558 start_codon:yes stop_codon:yes gene_type:complete